MRRPTVDERMAKGKAHRDVISRSDLGRYQPAANRPDPVALLASTDVDRLPDLIPLRHLRMLESPHAFLRGSPAAMAHDLGPAPSTGLNVQLCGDCHLLNFGGYATPERNVLFDIVDFDETLPGPFEWDVKRLAASIHVAGRTLQHSEAHCNNAVAAMAASYHRHVADFAGMRALEVWYAKIDEAALFAATPEGERGILKFKDDAPLSKHTIQTADGLRIKDEPPDWFHPQGDGEFERDVRGFLADYRSTLQADRQELVGRFVDRDFAMKVVGVGSVGTRCAVLLMEGYAGDYLLLQVKEARRPSWASFAEPSRYAHQGQRVVNGQRLMQSASDLFLGWATGVQGRHFYVRQFRDKKASIMIDEMPPHRLMHTAYLCGWALARAHARAGDAAVIAGYLGKSDAFVAAMAAFAPAYADQTERDYETLKKASVEP